MFVRGNWVRWPAVVCLLGKSVRTLDRATDFPSLTSILHNLKEKLPSEIFVCIVLDVMCCKFKLAPGSIVFVASHSPCLKSALLMSSSRVLIWGSEETRQTVSWQKIWLGVRSAGRCHLSLKG